MKKSKIIFIGGIGTKTQFGGELTKNKEIIIWNIQNLKYVVGVLLSIKQSISPMQ